MSKNNFIEESVCKFYLENKDFCNTYYDEAESADISNIYEAVSDKTVINSLLLKVSLVVLTANKYEKNVFHYHVFLDHKEKIIKYKFPLFPNHESKKETYGYIFKWKNHTVLHIEAQVTGSYTIGGSADIVRYIVGNGNIFPTAIISLGICFGTKEKENRLGDVVISQKIYPYFIGSKIKETSFVVSDDNMFRIDSDLNASIKSVKDQNAFRGLQCDVLLGNYITGEAVVSNKRARDEFVKTTTQQIIAGEMEGYGLFKECNASYSIPCVVIKSICDWAAAKNFDSKQVFERLCKNITVSEEEQTTIKDRIQAFSAFQAYNVLKILLSKQVFMISLYDRIVKHIYDMNEHVLFGSRIKAEILSIAAEYRTGFVVSDDFVVNILNLLMDENILSCSNYICYNGSEMPLNEQIWGCTFNVNMEANNV